MAATSMTCSMNKVVNTPTARPRCSSSAVQMHSRRAPAQASATLASSFTCGTSGSFRGSVSSFQIAPRRTTAQQPIRDVTTCAAKVVGMIKLALEAGKANPSPPVGPALGAKGVNIMAFCKEYNAATQDKAGTVIPVEITVFDDKSFKFILKTPPAAVLLKKYAGIPKGSPDGKQIMGSVTEAQLKEIAEIKLPDLNANDIEAAMKIVGGTAKNMGITIEG